MQEVSYTQVPQAFMLSLGCIQSLKCNSNKCPTGIATLDKELVYGLDPADKTHRVYHFQRKTVKAAAGITGIMGYEDLAEIDSCDVMRRVQPDKVLTLTECFPKVEPNCLLEGTGPEKLQGLWDYETTKQQAA